MASSDRRQRELTGTRLGPYLLQARLGSGGMGDVYRAHDTRLQRHVAVKVLSANLAEDATSRERFEREARTVAAINHPHICTIHDVGNSGSADFLVMEYLEGETLAATLGERNAGREGAKLLDFGLAKAASAPGAEANCIATSSARGITSGPLAWMRRIAPASFIATSNRLGLLRTRRRPRLSGRVA